MTSSISAPTYLSMVRTFVLANPLKAMLVASTFTFDPDVHAFKSSIFNEVTGTGYTAGGIDVEDVDVLLNTGDNCVEIVGADLDFGVVTVTDAATVVVYQSTGVATTSPVIAAFSFTPVSRTAETFLFLWGTQSAMSPDLGLLAQFNY